MADCLTRYPWPGNVRELRNAMERAALLSRGELILPEHLPARVRAGGEAGAGARCRRRASGWRKSSGRPSSRRLRKHDFNRTETAKALGISRRALIYKLQTVPRAGL